MQRSLVGSEMCIRDRPRVPGTTSNAGAHLAFPPSTTPLGEACRCIHGCLHAVSAADDHLTICDGCSPYNTELPPPWMLTASDWTPEIALIYGRMCKCRCSNCTEKKGLTTDLSSLLVRSYVHGAVGPPSVKRDSVGRLLSGVRRIARGECSCCLLYTSPSPRDYAASRMPSSA